MTNGRTAVELLNEIHETLASNGIDGSRTEARYIIEHVLKVDYASIISGTTESVTNESRKIALDIVSKRISRKPLAYCLGSWNFFGLDFDISEGVLVPRQDTEILVETAIDIIKNRNFEDTHVLDLYSGIGVILISIAANMKIDSGFGIEIDPIAHGLSQVNKKKNKLDFLEFRQADVLTELPLLNEQSGKFSVITANPPYIPTSVITGLQPEVSGFENPIALDGGVDGLDHIRFLAENAGGVLNKDGVLLVEIGAGQDKDVIDIFKRWRIIDLKPDLNGIPRVLVAQYE